MISRANIPSVPNTILTRCAYRSPWRSPWKPDLVRKNVTVTRFPIWVRSLRGLPGVYLIRETTTKDVVYVGRGRTCVKRALLRHFFSWRDDPRGPHHRALFDRAAVEVKVYILRDPSWVVSTEADIIKKYMPSENWRMETSNATCRAPGEDDEDVVRPETYEEAPF